MPDYYANHARAVAERQAQIAADRASGKEPSTAEIREYLERQAMTVAQEEQKERALKTEYEWVGYHPEYVASPANARLLREYLIARGLPTTLTTLSEAYTYLCDQGFLKPNPQIETQVLKRAQQKEIEARAAQYDHRIILESDAYEMPLEELRKLAEEQIRTNGL